MKVLMLRPSYRPEISGGTHLAIDLVTDFIKAGHEVEVITPISSKYADKVDIETDECIVHRISSKYTSQNVLTRILRYLDISLKMYRTAKKIKCDLIMTHSMPPLLGPLGARAGKKKKVPVLYWEQDIVSESLISTGIFGKSGIKKKLMYATARKLEKLTEMGSTHIITISDLFRKMHLDRGVNQDKVSVVYNWIDTNQVYPVDRAENPLFEELNIPRNKFIVSYCGNLGVPQNVEIMVDAAKKLEMEEKLLFVIFGGGSREEYIEKYVASKKPRNIMMFPLQPLERSQYVYSVGDVGLVIGREGTSKNGFPSKTWSIMAAGQAMIACFDQDSELTAFVKGGECGIAIKPDSPDLLAETVKFMFSNQDMVKKMGKNARSFVNDHFSRERATQKIITISENIVNSHI